MAADYDPHSTDAMFSRILNRLDNQDHILGRIEVSLDSTENRLGAMEKWRTQIDAKTALIAAGVSSALGLAGWILFH